MYEWKATNAIYLDDEVAGKGRQFKCRFLVPGLVKYDFGVCLLTKENADRFIQGFVGCPVIINHQDLTDKNAKEKSVGNIFSVWFDEKDGYYWCNGIITDKHAIELIDKGYSVSCQYTITDYSDNTTGALHNGNSYDKLIEDGKPEHLAIVNNPRYEGAIIAVNAILEEKAENSQENFEDQFKDTLYTCLAEGITNRLGELIASNEDNKERWITIKPHGQESGDYKRLKLREGETPKEGMKRVYDVDIEKREDKKEDNADNKQEKQTYKNAVNDEELISNMHKQTEKLSASEKDTLRNYVWGNRGEYLAINGTLRGDLTAYYENLKKWSSQKIPNLEETVKGWIKDIDNAMSKSSLPENVELYRGGFDDAIGAIFDNQELQEFISNKHFISQSSLKHVKELVHNKTFNEKGYMSTSYDKNLAFKGKVRLKLNAPKGLKGIALDIPNVGSDKEKEVLLDKGYTWQVKDVTEGLIRGEEVYIFDCYLVE